MGREFLGPWGRSGVARATAGHLALCQFQSCVSRVTSDSASFKHRIKTIERSNNTYCKFYAHMNTQKYHKDTRELIIHNSLVGIGMLVCKLLADGNSKGKRGIYESTGGW